MRLQRDIQADGRGECDKSWAKREAGYTTLTRAEPSRRVVDRQAGKVRATHRRPAKKHRPRPPPHRHIFCNPHVNAHNYQATKGCLPAVGAWNCIVAVGTRMAAIEQRHSRTNKCTARRLHSDMCGLRRCAGLDRDLARNELWSCLPRS
jgi:hypothetical protein